jgi:hypothetical protein
MKRKILASAILAALLSTTALADTSSINADVTGMGILENDYVRAGVNGNTGTFGSGGNTSPGLLFDSTGTGTFNTSYDYLTPGSPFDGFAVKVDRRNYTNNNGGAPAQITNDGNGLTDGDGTLSWTGGVSSVFDITNTYSLGATSPFVDITSAITMGVDATDVYFGRFIDPDARAAAGDSSATDNVLGYGAIPDSNVAFSEATVSRYALGLYSTDSNVDAGITMWTTDAASYTENSVDGDGSLTNTGDNTIGLSWHWTDVGIGDILTASYAYIFGPSAFEAAGDAIEGGAGGGADILTGTFEDVGSATDAAESGGTPAAPTLVSTSDPVVTYGAWGDWAHDTDLPVLTQSQTTHDASETATIQTIDRETTTIVTTPEERTRTTTTTVTDTYSDSSTVDRVTGTGTETATRNNAVTTVTDPGSFTGRIDQVATAQDVVGSVVRTMDFENIEGFRTNSKMKNGMSGNTSGAVIAGSKELENGVALSGGFTRMGTSLSGNGDTVSADTDMFAVGIANNGVKLEVRHAMTDYEVSRTIGDFSNAGEIKGTDTSARIMYSPDTGKVNPVFGYTRGKRTIDGYEETGSIQSARTVADTSEMYGYGTVGLRGDLGLVDFTVMHHTDGVNDVALGLEKEGEKFNWRAEATRSMTDLGNTNSLSAGISWKF